MGDTTLRALVNELEGFGKEPKWQILFYSTNPDGTISLTVKDNREAYEKAHDESMKELAAQSQEAANDNNE